MPRRPLLILATLLAATGCADTIGLSEPDVPTSAQSTCKALLSGVPESVAGQKTRSVAPPDAGRAWGDPAITLQCGVARPKNLTATSRCADIDGVGWLNDRNGDSYVFTTIGRKAYVRVTVPRHYQPSSDALVDLASAVKKHDPIVQNCV